MRKMFRILLNPDMGTPGLQWINQSQPLPAGHIPDRGNSAQGVGSGFWPMEAPVFVADGQYGRLPLADVEAQARDIWLISDRCKQVFERVDAAAFEFHHVEMIEEREGQQTPAPRYWLCDIVRFLDALDEEKSNARVRTLADGVKRARRSRIGSEVFRAEVIADNKVFRLMHAPSAKYVTEEFAQAIRTAGLNGFMLTEGGHVDACD